MPQTCPCVAIAANLLTVLLPPQPTSRIVLCGSIEIFAKPQSVNLECDQIHSPQGESTHPSHRLSALIEKCGLVGHGCSP
jgi:hypothetical protein